MKKICLILTVFSFFSVMPSFGLKLITNNENDRTVPSRCSGFNAEEYVELNDYENNKGVYRNYYGYQGSKFESFYKPVLSHNIRRELVGTTWYYPDDKQQKNVQKENFKESVKYSKSYTREAADYYFIDTIANPKKTVPVGY